MLQPVPILLVVDDEAALASELAHWLSHQGYNALAASSCLEARGIVDAVSLDGMIGHLGLRDGSFFDLARALRARRADLGLGATVIGYADVEVRTPPELDACLVRPFDPVVLTRYLGARRARRRSGEQPRVTGHDSVTAGGATKAGGRRR